jgi:hypothetical protein
MRLALTLFGSACAQLCVRRLSSDRRASLPSVNRRGARNFVSTVRLFRPVAVRRRFPPGIVLRRRRRHMRRLPGRHLRRLSQSRLALHKQTFCLSVSVLRTPPIPALLNTRCASRLAMRQPAHTYSTALTLDRKYLIQSKSKAPQQQQSL